MPVSEFVLVLFHIVLTIYEITLNRKKSFIKPKESTRGHKIPLLVSEPQELNRTSLNEKETSNVGVDTIVCEPKSCGVWIA